MIYIIVPLKAPKTKYNINEVSPCKMSICFGPNFESPYNEWYKDERSDIFVKWPILATLHAVGDHASVL